MNETKGEKMYYYALGNEFNFSLNGMPILTGCILVKE